MTIDITFELNGAPATVDGRAAPHSARDTQTPGHVLGALRLRQRRDRRGRDPLRRPARLRRRDPGGIGGRPPGHHRRVAQRLAGPASRADRVRGGRRLPVGLLRGSDDPGHSGAAGGEPRPLRGRDQGHALGHPRPRDRLREAGGSRQAGCGSPARRGHRAVRAAGARAAHRRLPSPSRASRRRRGPRRPPVRAPPGAVPRGARHGRGGQAGGQGRRGSPGQGQPRLHRRHRAPGDAVRQGAAQPPRSRPHPEHRRFEGPSGPRCARGAALRQHAKGQVRLRRAELAQPPPLRPGELR